MFGVKYRSFGCNGDLYAVFVTYVAVLLYLTRVNNGVKISSITVPSRVDNSSSEPAKLNCAIEYDQPSEATFKNGELVIQWKLNNGTLLYQWVYNGSSFLNKNFRDYIDTSYKILPHEIPTNMPLTFARKSVDLTGQYTCRVTTFTSEVSADAQLQVYVPVKEISLNVTSDEETTALNITCQAQGIYPRPSLELTTDKNISLELIEMSIVQEDYLFDISATYWASISDLSSSNIFNCTISLPAAKLSRSKTFFYKTESGSDSDFYSVTSEYTNNSTSSLKDDNDAGSSSYRCNCNILLLVYALFVILMLRK